MKYETSKERQQIGFQKFSAVHYKSELKEGSLKKMLKMVILCLIILIAFYFIFTELKKLILTFLLFVVCVITLGIIVSLISVYKSKKFKFQDNIVNFTHSFEDKYECSVYYKNGSVDRATFDYSDISKIVESEEFFYIYFKSGTTLPLDKQSVDDIKELKQFLNDRDIEVKGL